MRKEYHELSSKEMDAFGLLTDALSDTTGETFEQDDQYVFTEAISGWGEDIAYEVVELLEVEIGVSIEWDLEMECGKIAVLFSAAEDAA